MQLTLRRLIRIWCAFMCFLLPHGSSLSQTANVDVCAYFTGTPGQSPEYDQGNGRLVCTGFSLSGPAPASVFTGPTVRLLIALLTQDAAQAKNIADLRAELLKTTDALTTAVAALDAASKEISNKNAKWRDEALKKNLDAIANVPVNLAANEALRKALAAAIASDPVFLDEVKKAVK